MWRRGRCRWHRRGDLAAELGRHIVVGEPAQELLQSHVAESEQQTSGRLFDSGQNAAQGKLQRPAIRDEVPADELAQEFASQHQLLLRPRGEGLEVVQQDGDQQLVDAALVLVLGPLEVAHQGNQLLDAQLLGVEVPQQSLGDLLHLQVQVIAALNLGEAARGPVCAIGPVDALGAGGLGVLLLHHGRHCFWHFGLLCHRRVSFSRSSSLLLGRGFRLWLSLWLRRGGLGLGLELWLGLGLERLRLGLRLPTSPLRLRDLRDLWLRLY
mmetsp:Transcript_83706/g.200820  ORF Transcript_83706/g.200820 Transcript_83706/m.200820 type:complete len:268 (-) Transcript_83706:221-1024(-)